ncbi:p-loop containing nucleoside triphosphate hydrolase [Colletotrichum tofieldiae]|nr:p-loop containing nucleoside triphosphate hydrolase [Colletotrichum tofieldiae]
MTGNGSPTSGDGDISKPAPAPTDSTIHSGRIDSEPTNETNVTEPESQPVKPDENKTDEVSDSPPVDSPSSVKSSVSGQNESAENEASNNGPDNRRAPSPATTEDDKDKNLYLQYLDMVRRMSTGDTGESLLTGVVDYMKVVDERLQVIEEKLRNNEEEKENSVAEDSSPPSEAETPDPSDIQNEVKFFEADEEDINSEGNLVDMAADHARFSSTKDQPQVMRVLYNKLSDDATIDKVNPEPGLIDIIYLNILSDPVASFFRDVLALDCGSGHSCIRLSKPFRPLIRNMKPLRDHLAKLEKAYGYGNPELGASNEASDEVIRSHLQLDQTPEEAKAGTEGSVEAVEDGVKGAGEIIEPSPTPAIPPQGDASEHHEKPFLRPSALAHFRTITRFVDQYLQSSLELYAKIKSGKEDKVAFENLWMLFDAGTTIYCPYRSGKETFSTTDVLSDRSDDSGILFELTESRARYSPQAYCVLSTRGGTFLKTSLMPGGIEEDFEENDFLQNVDALLRLDRWDLFRHGDSGGYRKDIAQPLMRHGAGGAATRRNKNTTSTLVIACFNVEYDGDRFGTQRELFEVKPYSGLKEVRDLEVFPVQYLKDEEMDRLLQRGRKFVDLTNNAHMSYEGTTAGSTRETINSEVIVDFKTAFERSSDLPDISEIRPDFTTGTENHWPRTTERGQREAHDWYEHDAVDGERAVTHRWCFAKHCQKPTYHTHQDAQSQKVLRKLASLFESYATQQAKSKKAREELRLYFEENGLMSLFPGVVPGYALRNRKWVQLDLDRLQDVQHGNDWNNLVLPKGHREMVQAMVESYTRRSDGSQAANDQFSEKVDLDLAKDASFCFMVLLAWAKPLPRGSLLTWFWTASLLILETYRMRGSIHQAAVVSHYLCGRANETGDIGHLPEVVEANLERHFKLAHRWACVLLLDEADVFLAKRTKTDVKRNGLVSVFLRILEYYPGILFLTTNRVGAIDDAFRSRLHLTLYYPKLLEKQSTKIWKNNIGKLKEVNEHRVKGGQQPIKYDKHEIIKWASTNWESLQWNGRQIRNAFQTAIALAEFKAQSRKSGKRAGADTSSPSPKKAKPPVLDQDTFMLIADASNQFNDYLLQAHGQDEDTIAMRDQVRPASFKAKPTRIKRVQESSESESESDSDTASGSSGASDSSGPESDAESDATVDSASSASDSETDAKGKKANAKKGKGKSEKKAKKEKKSPDGTEKAKKKAKKKRSEA